MSLRRAHQRQPILLHRRRKFRRAVLQDMPLNVQSSETRQRLETSLSAC